MKFSEMTEDQRRAKVAYIENRWRGLSDVTNTTRSGVLGYIFVLNSGGLLAALTYVATKESNCDLRAAIWSFAAGTVFITLRAAVDYYSCEWQFKKFRQVADAFYMTDKTWEELIETDRGPSWLDNTLHSLGWLAGLLFVFGLVVGIHGLP